MSTTPETIIKQSLVENVYKKYHEFTNFLKTIPVNQNNQLAVEAYKLIDIGIICFEKVINHSPLILEEPAPIAVGEPNPTAVPEEVA